MPRPAPKGAYAYIGFRAPLTLKQKLDVAAAENGRSLSTEVQFRLERSLDRQQLIAEVLDLVLGTTQPLRSIQTDALLRKIMDARAGTAPV